MVINGNGENLLGLDLVDHILIEDVTYFLWRRQIILRRFGVRVALRFLPNDVITKVDTLVANKNRRTSDQLAHLMLALATKGTIKQFLTYFVSHCYASFNLCDV